MVKLFFQSDSSRRRSRHSDDSWTFFDCLSQCRVLKRRIKKVCGMYDLNRWRLGLDEAERRLREIRVKELEAESRFEEWPELGRRRDEGRGRGEGGRRWRKEAPSGSAGWTRKRETFTVEAESLTKGRDDRARVLPVAW